MWKGTKKITMIRALFASLCLLRLSAIPVTAVNPNDVAFSLALEWPNSFCIGQESKCIVKPPSRWIIHGLWPKSKSPSKYTFNLTNVSNQTLQRMNREWPSIAKNRTNNDFWKYEWEKHGRYAKENGNSLNVTEYFEKTLSLGSKYNIGQILEKCNITPSDTVTYNAEQINRCIVQETRHTPFLCHRCEKYILEVRICLDKNFAAVNCSKITTGLVLGYPKSISANRRHQSKIDTVTCRRCDDPNPDPDPDKSKDPYDFVVLISLLIVAILLLTVFAFVILKKRFLQRNMSGQTENSPLKSTVI